MPLMLFQVRVSAHHNFISFINKLISKIGLDKVVGGHATHAFPPAPDETTNTVSTFRAWLAAEMLCTWNWPGGSALDSFIPLLTAYAKRISYASRQSLFDSIFNILLDGALVYGGGDAPHLFNSRPLVTVEDDVKEPMLRALVSLIYNLLRDNIWDTDKAMAIFELLVNKLYIGEEINMNCLRILPPLMRVLIRPLSACNSSEEANTSTSQENFVVESIKGWLQKTLSFPPLVLWQAGQGQCYIFVLYVNFIPDVILLLSV